MQNGWDERSEKQGSLPEKCRDTGAVSRLDFLLRSRNRLAVLETLADSPRERKELQRATGTNRSTLSRVLAELDDCGWIERDGHDYRATTTGVLVAGELLGTIQRVESIDRLAPALDAVPTDALPTNLEIFSESTVTVAAPGKPCRPIDRFSELLSESETLQEFSPMILGRGAAGVLEEFIADGGSGKVLYRPETVSALAADAGDTCINAIQDQQIRVQVHDSLSFGLSLFDERIALVGYDGVTGAPAVLVDTADSAARQWAKRTFNRYCREATPIAECSIPVPIEIEATS